MILYFLNDGILIRFCSIQKGKKMMFDRYLQHPKCVSYTFLCNVLPTLHYEWLLNLARTCFLYCKMCMISENEIIYHNQTCCLISFNYCTYTGNITASNRRYINKIMSIDWEYSWMILKMGYTIVTSAKVRNGLNQTISETGCLMWD